jgi:hypothetical protein
VWIALVLGLALSCGDDDSSGPEDTTPTPAPVTDLAVAGIGDSTVTLFWTAPHELGAPKRATITSYDVRYGADSLTLANWTSATEVEDVPTPAAPGSPETLTVGGFPLGTRSWFALRCTNDDSVVSGISNSIAATTDTIDDRLLVYYPLIDDSIDVTGHENPITLVNAPFENGGVTCNGIYVYGIDPGGCNVQTPWLDSLDFEAFTIRCRFRVDEIFSPRNWVVVGGFSWRWMGCLLRPDTTVALSYNNTELAPSDAKYTLGEWHEVTLVYDGVTDLGELYLDGVLAASETFAIETGDDRNVGITNGAFAEPFKGTFGGLKVYRGVVRP